MTQNPDPKEEQAKKDADIRAIIERREAELAAGKAKAIEDERIERERKAAQEKAFQADVTAERERGEAKEEWRQGQHEKRREAEKERLRKLEEEKIEQQKRDAAAAKEEERKEYMQSLHRMSMIKKAAAMRKAALLELEHAMGIARDHYSTAIRDWEYRHGRDKRAVETQSQAAVRRLDQQTLTPDQKKKRLQELETERMQKLQEVENSFKNQKAEIEAKHAQEVAKAERIKNDTFALADKTQHL